jgi:membrane protein implicated in regulation of membrane protease activity
MEALFADFDFWHWLVLGLALIIIELFAWSTFFLWMGISAVVVGILLYLSPNMSWETQLLIFAFLSIVTIYLAKKFLKVETIDTQLNERASRHVGNIYTVAELDNNGAKVKVGDSLWLAKGCDMVIGQQVKVVGTDSTTLIVEDIPK